MKRYSEEKKSETAQVDKIDKRRECEKQIRGIDLLR